MANVVIMGEKLVLKRATAPMGSFVWSLEVKSGKDKVIVRMTDVDLVELRNVASRAIILGERTCFEKPKDVYP